MNKEICKMCVEKHARMEDRERFTYPELAWSEGDDESWSNGFVWCPGCRWRKRWIGEGIAEQVDCLYYTEYVVTQEC